MSITDYGAFVEIEPGVEGLIHISEMTWSRRMKHPSKVVKVGDHVEAVVLEVKPRDRRVSLGIKQLEADPWTTVADRYSIGSVVEGRVRKLTEFGAFLEIEEGVDGLVHVSDLSWTKHVKDPDGAGAQGAGDAGRDPEHRRAQPALVAGREAASAGCLGEFLPLARSQRPGARASVPRPRRSACLWKWRREWKGCATSPRFPPCRIAARAKRLLPIGEEYDFKIIKMNEAERKIGLSLRAVAEEEERARLEDYQRQAAAATMTIEEAMNIRGKGEGR